MALLMKMQAHAVTQNGGGALVPLCLAHKVVEAWPPPEESLSTIGIYGHTNGDCDQCDTLANTMAVFDEDEGKPRYASVTIPGRSSENIRLGAVMTEDAEDPNHEWAVATPSGTLEFTIANPLAFGQIEAGAEYMVKITKHVPNRARRSDSSTPAA